MRKRFAIGGMLVAVALLAVPASAQVGGGIKGGLNFATLDGINDAETSTSQRTGVVVGGFVTVGMGPMFAFQPEVLFSMQGTRLNFSESGIDTDATAKLDYLQVPLLLRIGNSASSSASLYGLVGPSLGLLMSADLEDEDIKDELKNTDVGLVVGAGVSLSRFFVEGRYTWGLTDLNKVEEPGFSNKNRVISFFVGLVF